MDTEVSGLWEKSCIDRLADWLFRGAGGSVDRLALTPRGICTPLIMIHHFAYIFLAFFLAFAASGKILYSTTPKAPNTPNLGAKINF